MNQSQLLLAGHQTFSVPSLIMAWIITLLSFLIIGLFSIDGSRGSHPYKKFTIIWFISLILSGLIVLFLILSPNTTQTIINIFPSI